MKTKLEELKAKQEKELRNMIAAEEIAATMEPAPDRVHVYPLHGVDASADYGNGGGYGTYSTMEQVAALAEKFPPLPLVLRRDGCTSFVLASWAEGKSGKLEEIAPFFIRADFACVPQHGHKPRVCVEWMAEVAGRVVNIQCWLAPSILRVSFRGRDQRNAPRIIDATEVTFAESWGGSNVPEFHTAGTVQRMDRIAWGRGSSECGHSFTYYTGCTDLELAEWARRLCPAPVA